MSENPPIIILKNATTRRKLHPGEEVVISGMSGSYPDCDTLTELRNALLNKVDLMTEDERRYENHHPELPRATGKIKELRKFDAGFFGVDNRSANFADPLQRIFLEKAVEAIYDAGMNPEELEGTNTGVIVGCSYSETEDYAYKNRNVTNVAITGYQKSFMPHKLSYFLKFNGPSMNVDTACSSSLSALEHGYNSILNGDCDRVIIGGSHLVLHPNVTLQFARLGVISKDGRCKVFDETADGYGRSETIAALLLERASICRRMYCQVVHVKSNCDGYKEQGINFPSKETQAQLLEDFYEECQVDVNDISYMEAHGTGTYVGDSEEVGAIDSAIAQKRKEPLLIGSVKSNLGHSETTSGLNSLAKAIITFHTNIIPPNINYNKPKSTITGIHEGRIQVVQECTPLDSNGLVGISNFGFGGSNVHVLLRTNKKVKINNSLPKDDIPRLVCVSGRTEEAILTILDDLKHRPLDAEYVALFHKIYSKDTRAQLCRGYTVISKTGEISRSYTNTLKKRPFILVFDSFIGTWHHIVRQLFSVPIFAATLQRLHTILQRNGINITDILLNDDKKVHPVVRAILGSFAVLIGLVDILLELGLKPDNVHGNNLGLLAATYFTGQVSFEDATSSALEIARNLEECSKNWIVQTRENKNEEIIANGISKKNRNECKYNTKMDMNIIQNIINGNEPNHGNDVCTGSELILKNRKVFSSVVMKQFKQISTTSPKDLSTSDLDKAAPERAVVLEIALGKGLTYTSFECVRLQLSEIDIVVSLLENLGKLYECGHNFDMAKLYPEIEFPVSQQTPMISPLIKWEHSKDWFVMSFKKGKLTVNETRKTIPINVKEVVNNYLTGHVVDGRNLFPATGYLFILWDFLAANASMITEVDVTFEDVKFIRATNLPKDTDLELGMSINICSGHFEILHGDSLVVTGIIKKGSSETTLPVLPLINSDMMMTTKDIYKELRLRGYNYKNDFRQLKECNLEGSYGLVPWNNNWVTFIDHMLQLKILQIDTRGLYVPVSIKKISISANKHVNLAIHTRDMPVYCYKDLDIIKCGGIEIHGMRAETIAKKKSMTDPVLEEYKFVPNVCCLSLQESIKVNLQLMMENNNNLKPKVIVYIDEEDLQEHQSTVASLVQNNLSGMLLVQPDVSVLCSKPLEIEGVKVSTKALSSEKDCLLAVGTNILAKREIREQIFKVLKPSGYVMSCENLDFSMDTVSDKISIITVHLIGDQKMILFTEKAPSIVYQIVKIDNSNFDFLTELQQSLKTDSNILIYAENEPQSGILGFMNCLKKEPGRNNIKCIFTFDSAPELDLNNSFYSTQINKNLTINIYKNGRWGTYRHVDLGESRLLESSHCFADQTTRGDLSSFKWIEGPISTDRLESGETAVQVAFSAMNFKDVMVATGRLNLESLSRLEQECVIGLEYSGRDLKGNRVAGILDSGALASLVLSDKIFLWKVPDDWSLEDAATISIVYFTVIQALIIDGKMKRGESILIHSGTGGIGLAALNVALHYDCKIYTTVGTPEKRDFLKKHYPMLTDRQIGNSRDVSFESMVMNETGGKGVDIVLNSLAEEKQIASVRCLARCGRFMEIGKFDLANNNSLALTLLKKEASFYGIMLDQYFGSDANRKRTLFNSFQTGLRNGMIKPLPRTVFEMDQIEDSFRYMTSGKHIGKVLVRIKGETNEELSKEFKCTLKYHCNPKNTYVITGGLGGFGMELADWLVLRGARKLVLTSRVGIKSGYQSYRIKFWRSYGVVVNISTVDVTTKGGCETLINEANDLGPIAAIFNLAVVLKDALIENQTKDNFTESLGPKALSTAHLDELSRRLCPELSDFVVFSSVSCGRGNAGQTNYGMANSVMERICEKRHQDGYPGLAIQWGAVGDVGIIADAQEEDKILEIGGTLQQRIISCIETMDVFMTQKCPIVSSIVVAEKSNSSSGAANMMDAVANILGIRNLKTVSFQSTLAELGMNSMTSVEIKQMLEIEFQVILSAQDIRSLTFARLFEIQQEKMTSDAGSINLVNKVMNTGLETLITVMGDEVTFRIPLYRLRSKVEKDAKVPKVFAFPGMEGVANVFDKLAANLNLHVLGLQFSHIDPDIPFLEAAKLMLPIIEDNVSHEETVNILMYSFGSIYGFEIVSMLEKKGYKTSVVCIDSAPDYVKAGSRLLGVSDQEAQVNLVCFIMSLVLDRSVENVLKHKERIINYSTIAEQITDLQDLSSKKLPFSLEYQIAIASGVFKRMRNVSSYQPSYNKVGSQIVLYKPKEQMAYELPNDYNLFKISENHISITSFEGNHATILENTDLAKSIESVFNLIVDG